MNGRYIRFIQRYNQACICLTAEASKEDPTTLKFFFDHIKVLIKAKCVLDAVLLPGFYAPVSDFQIGGPENFFSTVFLPHPSLYIATNIGYCRISKLVKGIHMIRKLFLGLWFLRVSLEVVCCTLTNYVNFFIT